MWNSYSTRGPVSVSARIISFAGGGSDSIHAYVASPDGDSKRPGIVLLHHMPGWDEYYFECAERLARHGYDVICPDLYCRYGHGMPDDVYARVRSEGGVPDDAVVRDAGAALSWLQAQPNHNGRSAVMGSCSGGRHAVLTASLVSGFDAVVDLWGGGVVTEGTEATQARPNPPAAFTSQLTAPLLGIFGNEDKSPSPEQVSTHERILQEAGKAYEFHRYDGAGHGFTYYHSPAYRQAQAMDCWEKVFRFLSNRLDFGQYSDERSGA